MAEPERTGAWRSWIRRRRLLLRCALALLGIATIAHGMFPAAGVVHVLVWHSAFLAALLGVWLLVESA